MWSRNTRGWPDIPYHYLIDPDGKIYEGRDITLAGDTNTEYDPVGHALVVVLGDFDKIDPNAAQLDATVNVMAMLAKRYNVAPTTIKATATGEQVAQARSCIRTSQANWPGVAAKL